MSIYRKKPIEIEAIQLAGAETAALIEAWSNGKATIRPGNHSIAMTITTLEGDMRADLGDFVICGVQGEYYPCKPDIFEQTYELVR